MSKLSGNDALHSRQGRQLSSLADINALEPAEKQRIYASIIPARIFELLQISPATFLDPDGNRLVTLIAPEGLGLARIEVRRVPQDRRTVFFLDIADTQFRQMELAFCIINDPAAPRFDVDLDPDGNDNCFATLGRNIPEEIRAMRAGLFPNQTSRGLRMFGEFFARFERFVDSLGMDMIVAEPLTYDNAIRYEGYGFDYLNGRRMMEEINREFRPGGVLHAKLDGSSPFRMPGMERTVLGRSWAIHDGILDEPWDDLTVDKILDEPWEDIRIYKLVGQNAGLNTFPERVDL
ncbi:hypothetical protein [Geobacter sp. SVR]|uniref:hypothetical protein n=1 Tax=Geobacter sp. SVR TaxID=2495594 RepID=UPI00143F0023|nr:hypothetical protein [Geobacter sp. SVR]BCS52762.1 hypothetical protein GSVR_10700 [Geobacter sp. SVR]GCF86742.1 hypothetical protein GSbR_33420 [Geobacter sp. SVR]